VTEVWGLAALWLGLALVATLLAIWLRVSTALSEIVVGTVAQLVIGASIGIEALGAKAPWIGFLSGTGAIVLTFLAGAELDPAVFRAKWKEASALGLVAFFSPFLGCTAIAYYGLHWSSGASWLAGIALSTTSVAVVYAVMLEFGLNQTEFGKTLLAACFINDLGTVLALGLIFAPFTKPNARLRRGLPRHLPRSSLAHPTLLREVWRSGLRARGEVPAAAPLRLRRPRQLGRQ
jgi:Kef-type K+ transport system membrane component KefB